MDHYSIGKKVWKRRPGKSMETKKNVTTIEPLFDQFNECLPIQNVCFEMFG